MKLLLHACCGPCTIMPERLLASEGHDITVLYANSNIAPRAEYKRRLDELVRYAADRGFPVIEADYRPERWERTVAPLGETLLQENAVDDPQTVSELLDDEHRCERCRLCYRMRLEEAARMATEQGFDGLATTLAVSPYQFTDVIHEELERAAGNAGIQAVFEDFRPYYDEATRISRERGMYRQNYCGCRFSIKEGEATRAFIKRQRAAEKERARAARAEQERSLEQERHEKARAKEAYAKKRARQRELLAQLREQEQRHVGGKDQAAL